LRDQAQIETLLGTVAPLSQTLGQEAVVWLASTVSPGYATALGEHVASAGAQLLDGPVSGGVSRAGAGKLTLILAGSDRAVAAAMRLAPALAEHVYRVATSPGPASAIKAVNQLLTAAHIALTAEALGLAIRAGVDPDAVEDVINASAGASRMFADRAPRMLADDATPHATLGIFLKDLGIALDAARQCGAATPMADAARDVFRQAAATFGSDVGDPAIFRLYRAGAAELS
jgi:3-hydroxyisobutyrate dehydrogenase